MGITRQNDIIFVMERLSYLRTYIQQSTSLNHTTINVVSENFFRDLLNMTLGRSFANLNVDLGNSAAIDLGDKSYRECIQVTSTSDRSKLKKTVDKFVEHGLTEDYDRLIILISTEKKNYTGERLEDKSGQFSISLPNDVWDWTDIIKMIDDLEAEKLASVKDFIDKGIRIRSNKEPVREVATLIDLMTILSDETHEDAGKGQIFEPDPDSKIRKRFSEHADYLLGEFASYYTEYGSVLNEAKQRDGLGGPRLRRLGLHLRTKSNKILTEEGGDPQAALDNLVEFYVDTLQENNKAAEEGAVRFFLLDQMLACHVFPMLVKKSA